MPKTLSFLEADITDLDALKVEIRIPDEPFAFSDQADHVLVSSDRDGSIDWRRS